VHLSILTADGNLFCGDLLTNWEKPGQPDLNSIMDDSVIAKESVKKLKSLERNTVYPVYGKPFPMEVFIKRQR